VPRSQLDRAGSFIANSKPGWASQDARPGFFGGKGLCALNACETGAPHRTGTGHDFSPPHPLRVHAHPYNIRRHEQTNRLQPTPCRRDDRPKVRHASSMEFADSASRPRPRLRRTGDPKRDPGGLRSSTRRLQQLRAPLPAARAFRQPQEGQPMGDVAGRRLAAAVPHRFGRHSRST